MVKPHFPIKLIFNYSEQSQSADHSVVAIDIGLEAQLLK